MAAASSTSTRRIRSRTRRRSPILSMLAILVISAAFCFTFGQMVSDRRQGLALFAAMGVLFVIGLAGIYATEISPTRCTRRSGAGRRQYGGQGGSLRRRQFGALGGGDDRRLERLGQRHARQLHSARRHDRHAQHRARRGGLRRRRRRPHRHAAAGHRHGVPRRADGRAHARISRQEDRGARGQARGADAAGHADRRAGALGAGDRFGTGQIAAIIPGRTG